MTAPMDLNLLRVFDAIVQAGSVTGAAEALHLSIPATSRALGRLRRTVGDPVLVRSGRQMTLTPFAVQAAPGVRSLLEAADALVGADRAVDPATLNRTFTIRINDGVAATLAAAAVAAVHAVAPAVTLRFVAEGDETADALRDGSVDLDIGAGGADAPDIHRHVLYRERLVGIVGGQTPLGRRRRPTLAALCSQPHVSVSRRGRRHGPLDDVLAEAGLRRRVAAIVPSFAVATLLVASSSYVALVPSRLGRQSAAPLGLRAFTVPAALPELDIAMSWHERVDVDAAHRWLRETLAGAVR